MEKSHSYSKLPLWVMYVACWRSSLGRHILPAAVSEPYSSQLLSASTQEETPIVRRTLLLCPRGDCDIKQHDQRDDNLSAANLDQDNTFCFQKTTLSLCELAGECI